MKFDFHVKLIKSDNSKTRFNYDCTLGINADILSKGKTDQMPLVIKEYPFEPNFFFNQAKQIRKEVSMPLVYLGGVDSSMGILELKKAGFDFIALARPLIHDSNFLNRIKNKEIENSGCTRCNDCVVEMDRGGVGCVI